MSKVEAEKLVTEITNHIRKNFNRPLARIRCDISSEYLTKRFLHTFAQQAMIFVPTTPHTLQHNAISERSKKL